MVVFCNYKQVELLGIGLGIFECAFLLTMVMARPSPTEMMEGLATVHTDPAYLKLMVANIGAVIMPWMIYFQQSAIVAKGLGTPSEAMSERCDTLVGSLLTQGIMIGTLITMAATRSLTRVDHLETVGDMANAMAVAFGPTTAKVLLSLGLVGGSLCAAFVVALAAAWGIAEACGDDEGNSLDLKLSDAPKFYATYGMVVLLGALILLAGVDVVQLNIYIEMGDALLMPVALFFLYFLATGPDLPAGVRVEGVHKTAVATIFLTCSLFAIFGTLGSLGLLGIFSEDGKQGESLAFTSLRR